ncbi:probable serine/threonine-protein kinase clkA [Hyposmocoma kahamanoa]|uniref:probable serine/threonine-protein kinase clkA n=1 Tax=Hyposmocoma kahamanoa TaxID=1477025 RepID=UPI000E6D6141|nr:probable serine/threonine-protein kinase clkA [Hyposmocoma kahamanoa]
MDLFWFYLFLIIKIAIMIPVSCLEKDKLSTKGVNSQYYPNSEEDCAACGCYYPFYPSDMCRVVEKCTKACEAVYDILCIDPRIQKAIRCWFSKTCQTNCYATFIYTTKSKKLSYSNHKNINYGGDIDDDYTESGSNVNYNYNYAGGGNVNINNNNNYGGGINVNNNYNVGGGTNNNNNNNGGSNYNYNYNNGGGTNNNDNNNGGSSYNYNYNSGGGSNNNNDNGSRGSYNINYNIGGGDNINNNNDRAVYNYNYKVGGGHPYNKRYSHRYGKVGETGYIP